ncbi:MAG: prepilin-type N-terminal cleavage/methylation domain-containing protein [Candidatus Gastranaerophilales bacterium]|nr:prepilin-type N-terminal cleavage/methylation domain-containing protein [Candidatus Gastranaerophilales bacterium]
MDNKLKNNKSVMLKLVRSISLMLNNWCKKLHPTKLNHSPIHLFTCKQAFTFAELMISLVVISILAAVLYPNLMHFNPNSNKPLFKAAYKTLSNALAEITVDKTNGQLVTTGANTGQRLCIDFCNKANVIDEVAGNTCTQNCADNILTTTNGMRWLFENHINYPILEYHVAPIPQKSAFRITVDVNSSNNTLSSSMHCGISTANNFSANGHENDTGIFCYDNTTNATNGIYTALPNNLNVNGTFNLDNVKAQDTFQFLVDEKGKIISISPVGWAILEDSIQLD